LNPEQIDLYYVALVVCELLFQGVGNRDFRDTATMASIVIDDVAILKCPICLDIFDKPKLLSCGHTLCNKCINQLHVSSQELHAPFTCPECRRNVDVPDGGTENMPPNFVIQRLLDNRECSSNAMGDTGAQADNDIDGLTRVVFRLKQRERSLEDAKSKLLAAVRHEEAAIQRKGEDVKRQVDEQVGKLLEKLRALRDDNAAKIATRLERVQTEIETLVNFCSLYGELRRRGDGIMTQERLGRLHSVAEELLQHDVAYDDVQVPSLVFSPESAAGRHLKNLVGELDEVDETPSTGRSDTHLLYELMM